MCREARSLKVWPNNASGMFFAWIKVDDLVRTGVGSEVLRPAADLAVHSSWTPVPQGSQRKPLPRYEHAAALLPLGGGSLFVVGGNYGERGTQRCLIPIRFSPSPLSLCLLQPDVIFPMCGSST